MYTIANEFYAIDCFHVFELLNPTIPRRMFTKTIMKHVILTVTICRNICFSFHSKINGIMRTRQGDTKSLLIY